jgi:hypothetical protein
VVQGGAQPHLDLWKSRGWRVRPVRCGGCGGERQHELQQSPQAAQHGCKTTHTLKKSYLDVPVRFLGRTSAADADDIPALVAAAAAAGGGVEPSITPLCSDWCVCVCVCAAGRDECMCAEGQRHSLSTTYDAEDSAAQPHYCHAVGTRLTPRILQCAQIGPRKRELIIVILIQGSQQTRPPQQHTRRLQLSAHNRSCCSQLRARTRPDAREGCVASTIVWVGQSHRPLAFPCRTRLACCRCETDPRRSLLQTPHALQATWGPAPFCQQAAGSCAPAWWRPPRA